MAEPYQLELGILSKATGDPANASSFSKTDLLPASRKEIKKLKWSYSRPGGCNELTVTIQRPFDQLSFRQDLYPLDRGGITHFRDVVLNVRGLPWWRGYVVSIKPTLAIPETIDIKAFGYAHRAEEANLTWSFGRQSLKNAGAVGEIAGVVQALWALAPLLIGQGDTEAHALGDGAPRVDFPSYRADALRFQNQSLYEIFGALAEMAGNFDWGVDENRQFYFVRPQLLTSTLGLLGNPTAIWSADGSGGYAADETYLDPQSVPPYLPIENTAVFVVGGDVQTYQPEESIEQTKNVLIVYGSPARPGDPTPIVTVANPGGIAQWGRRLVARVSAPGLYETRDLVQWATQRLQLLSRAQIRGGLRAPEGKAHPAQLVHPLGAVRMIGGNQEVIERILSVEYEMAADGNLTTTVNLGYGPPTDRRIGEQLRRDATLIQNIFAADATVFVLRTQFSAADLQGLLLHTIRSASAFDPLTFVRSFQYCGLGKSNLPNAGAAGNRLQAPLMSGSVPYRQQGTSAVVGSTVTLSLTFLASDIIATGSPDRAIKEAALYQTPTSQVALRRFVFPAPLVVANEGSDIQLAIEIDVIP